MDFRERLDCHLRTYPFDAQVMLAGNKTAYGMFLFQEAEHLAQNKNITLEFLNLKKYFPHDADVPVPEEVDFVVLWGVSDIDANTQHLLSYAENNKKPILIIEDGFIRSLFPMPYCEVSASMRIDAEGCYYDSFYPSAIENLLNKESFSLSPAETQDVRSLIDLVVKWDITKYNLSKKYIEHSSNSNSYASRILIIDQVYGDMSIQKGGIKDAEFNDILLAAINENPQSLLLVKLHPETVLGIRRGHFDNQLLEHPNIKIISEDINPISMIKYVDKVYCATTQMGFEALLCGKDVQCFGRPFYAGWGVTTDRKVIPRRTRRRSIEELFYASYIYNVVYLDPRTKKRCEIKDVIDYFVKSQSDPYTLLKLKNDFLELKIKRIERKLLDIDPLKDTSVKFEAEFKKLNDGFFVQIDVLLMRIKRKLSSIFKKQP